MAPHIPFIYFFFILLSTTKFSFTHGDTNMKPILSCTNTTTTATDLDSFTKNYNSALSVASVRAQYQGFGFDVEDADKTHSNSTIVYAYGECLKGLAFLDSIIFTSLVYDDINGECLQKRKGARGGRAFRGHCLLRYDDHDFRGETSSVADESLCSYYGGNQTNSLGFQDMAGEFLRKMSIEAPKNGGFYFGMNLYQNTGEAIYGAAQCLEYVNDTTECERCLTSAATKGKECLSRPEGIVLNYGCFMTYAPYNFYRK